MNNGLLAGLLFLYIFVIQFVPLAYSVKLAAQLSIGLAGVLLGFYLAKLNLVKASTLFLPVVAYFAFLIYTNYDASYIFFASFGLLLVVVFALTWSMRRK
ncbi:MAG: hypothetical protein ABSG92_08035 [Conexivisphaerales archaeon]